MLSALRSRTGVKAEVTVAGVVCGTCGAEASRVGARFCDACGAPFTAVPSSLFVGSHIQCHLTTP